MALDHLYETKVNKKKRPLFSHPEPFVLCVDSLHHKPPPTTSHAHPLNDHYADIGDTYADASTKRGQQVASGRLDVFLPWKPPRERPSDHFMDWQTHKGHADLYDTSNGDEDEDDGGDPGYDYDSYGSDRPNDDDDYDQPEGPWWNNDDDEWGRGLAPRSPGLEPDPDDDSDVLWMNEVAEDEAGLYLRQRDAVMFYRNAVPRRTSSLPDFGSRTRHRQGQLIEPPAEKKEDPLMIFRTPPPWGALPSSPPAKPASRAAPPSARGVPTSVFASGTRPPSPSKSSSKALLSSHDPQNPVKFPPTFTMPPPATGHSPPFKRRRIEQTGPADQARRSMHALSSIQSLFSMVQKRTDDATAQLRDSKGKGRVIGSGATGRINPFARAVQEGKPKSILGVKRKVSAGPVGKSESESSLDSGSSRSTAHPTASPAKVKPHRRDHVTPTKSKPSQGSTATPKPSATEASTSTVASETPPPAKKLKPITSLPVPDWPNAHFKPVSEHRPKPAPVKARVQTTLPVSRPSKETVKPPDGDSERRRVSAPVMVTPRLKSGPAGQPQQSARSKEGKEKSKAPSKGGKGKEVKAGPFDWNKWSTAG
ncbi:hypothetical protein C8Q78DRAFT_124412 [Trametes maxima]|nr:hypothetical protein C8Q78DRAFT_124412 [Trametes maxima]